MEENKENENENEPEVDDLKALSIKRSSLKPTNGLSPLKNVGNRGKRGSLNLDMAGGNVKCQNMKQMKISFKLEGSIPEKRKFSDFNIAKLKFSTDKFKEARKMSIKNEFSKVKELLKIAELEDEQDESNILENTKKNQEIGKMKDDSLTSSEDEEEKSKE